MGSGGSWTPCTGKKSGVELGERFSESCVRSVTSMSG